eukprot:TRINITY_DN5741_c0_g1_i1.p1 TRINITY_DN5741_c0_g1~~TRINITY_DN5741_c0_g1_i1.p1  ORF type:complete len:1427 (-),score=175.58 TRINITY_DN5741_c0_g1_i1:1387-5667(-)
MSALLHATTAGGTAPRFVPAQLGDDEDPFEVRHDSSRLLTAASRRGTAFARQQSLGSNETRSFVNSKRHKSIFEGNLLEETAEHIEVDVEQLEQLKAIFDSADTNGGGSLDEEEFIQLAPIIGQNLTKEQLRLWFMRIDANANGCVDWEEFSSYLLLENREDLVEKEREYAPLRKGERNKRLYHRGMISQILPHPHGHCYVTGCEDGTLSLWNEDLAFQGSLPNVSSSFVTGGCFHPSGNSLITTAMDRVICLWNLNERRLMKRFVGHQKFGRIERSQGKLLGTSTYKQLESTKKAAETTTLLDLFDPPSSMDFITIGDRDHLLLGLHSGDIQLYNISKQHSRESAGDGWHTSAMPPAIRPVHKWTLHSDSVSRVRYCEGLSGFITTSWDRSIKITSLDQDLPLRTLGCHSEYDHHEKSIFAFAWNSTMRVIAACGADRDVFLWNPWIQRPLFRFDGGACTQVDVCFDEKDMLLIALGTDKTLRVWDMRNYKLFQTIHEGKRQYPEDMFTALAYDQKRQRIIVGASYPQALVLQRAVTTNFSADYCGHLENMVAALYASHFHQVVSVDAHTVNVWRINDGEKVFSFALQEETITSACLDYFGRRLILGLLSGLVYVYNYINGQQLKRLDVPPATGETRCCCYVNKPDQDGVRFMFTASADILRVWKDGEGTVEKCEKIFRHPAGTITCCIFCPPGTVAVGSVDGVVTLYNINTMRSTFHLGRELLLRHLRHAQETNDTRSSSKLNALFATLGIAPPGRPASPSTQDIDGKSHQDVDAVSQTASSVTRPGTAATILTALPQGVPLRAATDSPNLRPANPSPVPQAPLTPANTVAEMDDPLFDDESEDEDEDKHRFGGATALKAVEDAVYIKEKDLLATVMGDHYIFFWDIRKGTLHQRFNTRHFSRQALFCIAASVDTSHIAVGDDDGYIFVYDIKPLPPGLGFGSVAPTVAPRVTLPRVSFFEAHVGAVQGISFASFHGIPHVITCAANGECRCFAIDGNYFGHFGQSQRWSLTRISSPLHFSLSPTETERNNSEWSSDDGDSPTNVATPLSPEKKPSRPTSPDKELVRGSESYLRGLAQTPKRKVARSADGKFHSGRTRDIYVAPQPKTPATLPPATPGGLNSPSGRPPLHATRSPSRMHDSPTPLVKNAAVPVRHTGSIGRADSPIDCVPPSQNGRRTPSVSFDSPSGSHAPLIPGRQRNNSTLSNGSDSGHLPRRSDSQPPSPVTVEHMGSSLRGASSRGGMKRASPPPSLGTLESQSLRPARPSSCPIDSGRHSESGSNLTSPYTLAESVPMSFGALPPLLGKSSVNHTGSRRQLSLASNWDAEHAELPENTSVAATDDFFFGRLARRIVARTDPTSQLHNAAKISLGNKELGIDGGTAARMVDQGLTQRILKGKFRHDRQFMVRNEYTARAQQELSQSGFL